MSDVTFEAIDALGGLFALKLRSPTLDGTIPLRAAQYCTPFLEGNGAGVQIYSKPAVFKRDKKRAADFYSSWEKSPAPREYRKIVSSLSDKRILAPYWAKKLKGGLTWRKGRFLYLWTGLLVRPAKGISLVVGGAYNRRVPLDLEEVVYSDSGSFLPLILKIRSSSVSSLGNRLGDFDEVGCMLAVKNGVRIKSMRLQDCADIAHSVSAFYDEDYYRAKREKPTGRYRKLIQNKSRFERSSNDFIFADMGVGGFRFVRFKNFITPHGIVHGSNKKSDLQFVVVQAPFPFRADWDGHGWARLTSLSHEIKKLQSDWFGLVGEKAKTGFGTYLNYAGGFKGEPYLQLLPFTFMVSPPGWSCFMDGLHLDGLEGLRGVVSTDLFHQVMCLYRAKRLGRFSIRRHAPVLRILPVPRSLLRPHFKIIQRDD